MVKNDPKQKDLKIRPENESGAGFFGDSISFACVEYKKVNEPSRILLILENFVPKPKNAQNRFFAYTRK
jgi:hypothetical protein